MSLSDLNGVYHLEDHDVSEDGRILSMPADQGKYGLVLIFAYWCHNCSGIKPEIVKLLPIVSHRVRIYAINGTGKKQNIDEKLHSNDSEMALMKRVDKIHSGFRGFPTVLLCDPNGAVLKEYNGQRNADGMLAFLKENVPGM